MKESCTIHVIKKPDNRAEINVNSQNTQCANRDILMQIWWNLEKHKRRRILYEYQGQLKKKIKSKLVREKTTVRKLRYGCLVK